MFFQVFVFCYGGFAQSVEEIIISGYVTDAKSGEKLLGAEIYEKYSGKGTVANEHGYFHLQVPVKHDSLEIHVNFLGYKSFVKKIQIKVQRNITLNVKLLPGEQLEEVVIRAESSAHPERKAEMSRITLSAEQLKQVPVIFAEPDVIKVMHLLPGVQQGKEGFGGMFVRGGGMDQNLFLLDDVPLYYINHLGGFISVFNNDAINQVTLYKGDFPARYGNRLSSVLDVRMRDGNKKEYHGAFMLGLISAKFTFEGPIIKDKTSFIVSARRFPYEILFKAASSLGSEGEESFAYTFYDYNIKVNHRASDKDDFDISWYLGEDAFMFSEQSKPENYRFKGRMGWGNHLLAVRWRRVITPKLFANTIFSYTRYRLKVSAREKDDEFESYLAYISGIRDLGLKTDMDLLLNENHKIKFGIGGTYHRFKPGVLQIKESDLNNETDTVLGDYGLRSGTLYAYAEWKNKIGKRFKSRIGLRLNNYITGRKNFPSVEPRIGVNYLLKENLSLKASYTQMQQTVHLLSSSGLGLPVDLWLPPTEKAPPAHAWQAALGIAQTWPGNAWDWSLEIYYKELKHLITYRPGESFLGLGSSQWESIIVKNGKGYAYGAEILIRKLKGKWTGWLAYTYARSMRRFSFPVNDGKWYPFVYDRPHSLNVVFQYPVKKNVNFSASWTFGSGYPVTLPIGYYSTQFSDHTLGFGFGRNYIYTTKNGYRMRPYHRLDLSLQMTKKKKYGQRTWTISVYNAYNRQNPFYYYMDGEYNEQTRKYSYGIYQMSLFPILPSVSYSYRF